MSASRAENALAGWKDWWPHPAPRGAIEGYASRVGLRTGDPLELHVSTSPPARYQIEIARLGWYSGDGARRVATLPSATGIARHAPIADPLTGQVRAEWPATDRLAIDLDWATGQYVAILRLMTGPDSGSAALVPFVVLAPPGASSDLLIQMPTNTAQAYNHWGGKSLYTSNSDDGLAAVKASFDRPVPQWDEANPNSLSPFVWDLQLIRFLEREAYDVGYTTDWNTHDEPWTLLLHRVVLTSGHDAYWTREMRDAFERARDQGVHLVFMGANTAYWQTRYEDAGRTMVQYRDSPDPEPDPLWRTTRFRDLDPPRPEADLLGVQYEGGIASSREPPRDYEVLAEAAADPWIRAAGLKPGDRLAGIVGYEWDTAVDADVKERRLLLGHRSGVADAHAVRHRASSGAAVLSTGSVMFSWGLDDWGSGRADERAQGFLRAALDEMLER